jgi:hypothetical protein
VPLAHSRDEAYDDFCRSLKADPDSFAILIVDSEDPVPSGKTAVAHLRDREKHWTKLVQASQVGLMVQCMEAWFLADRTALVGYYGAELKLSALPGNPKIEQIPKRDVMNGLENATRATQKGLYHKTKHGFDLLGLIDPNLVIKSSSNLMTTEFTTASSSSSRIRSAAPAAKSFHTGNGS